MYRKEVVEVSGIQGDKKKKIVMMVLNEWKGGGREGFKNRWKF